LFTRYTQDESITLIDKGKPQCYEEAMIDNHKAEWAKAMQEEMQFLHENHTYNLVELSRER